MTKLRGFTFSVYDLVENENIPTMKVMYWSSDNSYSLAPQWSKKQTMYDSFESTNDGYDREYLQELADDFNNYDKLPEEYEEARKLAVEHLIKYNKSEIKERNEDLAKLLSMQEKIGKPEE